MIKRIFLSLFFAVFVFTNVASAHGGEQNAQVVSKESNEVQSTAGMLPGNPFYFLEILSENISNFFIFNEIKKAERLFELAEERLSETEELANLGEVDRVEKATQRYEKYLEKALKKAEEVKEKGEDTDKIFTNIAESSIKNQLKLAAVHEKVPKEAKEAIEHAMEESIKGHDRAFEAISEEKQIEIETELEQIFEEVDSVLEELRVEGVSVPKIKGREHHNKDKRGVGDDDNFDEMKDEVDNLGAEFEELYKDLDGDFDDLKDELGNLI